MYKMKYELFLKGWRDSVDLTLYTNVITEAIQEYIPNATNIIIAEKFYSYGSRTMPTRGQLIRIGRYISYHSMLEKYVKQYESTGSKWEPSRKLFKRAS